MTPLPERLQDVIVEFRRIAKDHEIRADRPHQDDATRQWHMGTSEAYDDAADRLEAAQALQAAPEGGWRTIDSAPRDGTVVMFHVPEQYAPHMGRGDDWHGGFAYWLKGATHWRPLPEPPAAPSPTAALQAGEAK